MEPRRGGVLALQNMCSGWGFPLPEFREGIFGGPQPHHVTLKFSPGAGTKADLEALAKEDPFAIVKDAALLSRDGTYGLLFVERGMDLPWDLRASILAGAGFPRGDFGGGLWPTADIPRNPIFLEVHDQSQGLFALEVLRRLDEVTTIAEYGHEIRSLREWWWYLIQSRKYRFAEVPAAA